MDDEDEFEEDEFEKERRLAREDVEWWQKHFDKDLDGERVIHGRWGAIREDGQPVGSVRRTVGGGQGRARKPIFDQTKVRSSDSPTPPPIIVNAETASAYATLGLMMSATPTEVKKTFRKLMKQHHPDVSKEPDAAEKTRRISEAYKVLRESGRAE